MANARIIHRPEVEQRTGLSRSTIYRKLAGADPTFPRPVKTTGKRVGWLEDEIEEWLRSLDRT